MAGGVKVSLAFGQGALVASPTWTDITTNADLVSSFTIDRGRQFEVDMTDIGRANLLINDQHGILDPTNSTGPYYTQIEPLTQLKIELYNPVTAAYTTVFRGYVSEMDYVFNPAAYDLGGARVGVNQLTMSLVDALFILELMEMQADGSFGDPVPAANAGNIFFASANVDIRIDQVLGNAGWPSSLATVFTGNVSLQDSVYSPGQTVLEVIQEAADAEFPGLGNVYASKDGKVTFHGRKAKFDPVGVSAGAGGAWAFTTWKAGDGKAVAASPSDTAQVREFSFNRGLARVINYATAWPQGIATTAKAGQTVKDTTSIGLRGFCTWAKENLLVLAGTTTGHNANDECKLYATYYVDNYAQPRNRITNLAVRSLDPTDSRAAPTWAFLVGVEISDLLDVTVSSPGGGGFNLEPHFVEGLHYDVRPLNATYADVTVRPDLSPKAYFTNGTMFGY